MGYIGQMPGRPEELPGRETATGAPPEPGGAGASELPALLTPGTRSVTLSVPVPSAASEDPDMGEDDMDMDEPDGE